MRTIPLSGKRAAGREALVDDEDYELVSQYTWNILERVRPNGTVRGPYAKSSERRDGKQRSILMHTVITGWPRVDHANHNGLDNQRHNLRIASKSQNKANSLPQPNCASPYKGVSWFAPSRRWRARITVGGRTRGLGYYATEVEAAAAYDSAAADAFGEFAYLNFPQVTTTTTISASCTAARWS